MQERMLRIQLEKHTDGSVVLRCTRSDGSCTWQKHVGRMALFYPFHDLTHFAVESVLEFESGFFGLIARGWDIADTSGKGARGALPREAVLVEHIVGLLDRERIGGAPALTASEFNQMLRDVMSAQDTDAVLVLTEDELNAVRAARSELYDRVAALQPEDSMELIFDVVADRASSMAGAR